MPKQFSRFIFDETLFELTVTRNSPPCSGLMIVSNEEQFAIAARQLQGLGVSEWSALIEPCGRNTAPAIALACMALDPEEVVLATPSDQIVRDEGLYHRAVERAAALAGAGMIATLGIPPAYPETGFGYIEVDGDRVKSFKEKPDPATAAAYLRDGAFYWNAGILCFRAGVLLAELAERSPEVYGKCRAAADRAGRGKRIRVAPRDMAEIPSISVDYAVLEKSPKVACVPCGAAIGWNDLGSFDAIYDYLIGDGPNATHTARGPILVNSRNNLVIDRDRQVALIDVEDLLIVNTEDALLVSRRGSSQKVKELFAAGGRDEPEPRASGPLLGRRVELGSGGTERFRSHETREECLVILGGGAEVALDGVLREWPDGEARALPRDAECEVTNRGRDGLVLMIARTGR